MANFKPGKKEKMIREIYITETNCITPLGFDVESNVEAILRGESGIQLHGDVSLMPNSFYASIISTEKINSAFAQLSLVGKAIFCIVLPIIHN